MRGLLFSVLLLSISSCVNKSTTTSSIERKEYESVAYNAFGVDAVEFDLNSQGDYVLATFYDSKSEQAGISPYKYAVIELASNQIVKQETLPRGNVSWENSYTLKIVIPPGIPKNGSETVDDYTSFYNIKSSVTTNKKEASN